MKYYQKTSQFDEKLPIFSLSYLYVGLFIHIIMSWVLLTDDTMIPERGNPVQYSNENE